MNKLKTLTVSSVLTVLAASCDAAAVQSSNFKLQAENARPQNVSSTTVRVSPRTAAKLTARRTQDKSCN